MDAANQLFYAKGVDAATNTEIAEAAQVSIGSLYRFFPNKEALVAEYVDRYTAELASHLPNPLPTNFDISELDELVEVMIERSAEVRRTFVGFGAVRIWTNHETGNRPAQSVADAEHALLVSLFESSIYEIDQRHISRMCTVIRLSSYPTLELLPEVSKAEGARLIAEIKLMLGSYIRASVDTSKLK